jgi:hypothetical protein
MVQYLYGLKHEHCKHESKDVTWSQFTHVTNNVKAIYPPAVVVHANGADDRMIQVINARLRLTNQVAFVLLFLSGSTASSCLGERGGSIVCLVKVGFLWASNSLSYFAEEHILQLLLLSVWFSET